MDAATKPDPNVAGELPRTFGPYTLFELVGQGGMAQIYLARAQTELGATRLAIVKQILPSFADDPRFAEMLIHEAKLAARLSHMHIVQVFDLGKHDDHLYIAMEYVEGFDLNALLRQCTEKKQGLPYEHAIAIVSDVLSALDYAHRRADDDGKPLGIVHRDVSPSNILVSFEGEVKLCDFGIAHANDLVKEEANEALKGKAGYMSPEHARGDAIDARADVFAAGIILWELLAGKRLYKPKSPTPLVEQAKLAEIPALPDKGIPQHAKLEAIARRALAKDREERFSSASAMLRELEQYVAETGLPDSRLELGRWMTNAFGTEILEKRRASERKLPKSSPPPRSSERVRAGTLAGSGVAIPAAPKVPSEPSEERPKLLDHPVSDGAVRAFKKELESAPRVTAEPGSLAGAAMDVAPTSSSNAVDPAGASASDADDSDDALAVAGRPSHAPGLRSDGKVEGTRARNMLAFVAFLAALAAIVALVRMFVQ
ncbi:MAG: serine/threonine protein kinase [Deltaproteobacteria bacterium]|nr:serine/threonine protein kinase [Deltaproteobacteria bacterium]